MTYNLTYHILAIFNKYVTLIYLRQSFNEFTKLKTY